MRHWWKVVQIRSVPRGLIYMLIFEKLLGAFDV